MSVSQLGNARMRMLGQPAATPGFFLPTHVWFGAASAISDATGGFLRARVVIAGTRNKFFVSFEGVSVAQTGGAAVNASVALVTQESYDDPVGGSSQITFGLAAEMVAIQSGFAALVRDTKEPISSMIFLPDRADPEVEVERANTAAGITLFTRAWGFAWAKGARATGIPRRP